MPPISTVLLPARRVVEPPPPPPLGGGAVDEPALLDAWVEGAEPFAFGPPADVLDVPPGVRPVEPLEPVAPGVLLPGAVAVAEVLVDASGRGPPRSLFAELVGVPAVVLEDDATACWCGELVPTTAATTPTTATTATAAQTLRFANNRRL